MFLLNPPLILAGLLVLRYVPETSTARRPLSLDIPGALLRRVRYVGSGDGAHHGRAGRMVPERRFPLAPSGRGDFTYGQFGENFTVDGLADDQVCIGDRYRIGAAIFEVTQPRVTCYRVGIRMDDPRIPALLISHHRPGFYLRVLREGAVRAGNDIIKIASGPEGMTVAETDALLYLPGHPRDQVQRALRIPRCPPGGGTRSRRCSARRRH